MLTGEVRRFADLIQGRPAHRKLDPALTNAEGLLAELRRRTRRR